MSADESTERRTVRSDDPSLSAEANRLLTGELRQVIGSDSVELPAGQPDHSHDRHATHSTSVASIIGARVELVVTVLVVAIAGGVAALAVSSWWVIIPLFALAVLGMFVVVGVLLRSTSEPEHVSPTVAARLEEEGVGDPDRLFSELVDDFSIARERPGPPRSRPGARD